MTEVNHINIPQVNAGELTDTLCKLYLNAIKKGLPVSYVPSVFLSGAMGVGKSSSVFELGRRLEKATGKKVAVRDIRLMLMSPVDLLGLPVANEDKTAARWITPEMFIVDPSEDVINIIFLDELSNCPPAVQSAAYQIVLDRRVGGYSFPSNTVVIAAGNRLIDRSNVFKMPRALCNRLIHFEVTADYQSWRKWAFAHNISSKVIGFLGFNNNLLMKPEYETDDPAFPTPRSWEMVSKALMLFDDDESAAYSYICGCVGSGAAIEFNNYCKIYSLLPDVKSIFKGTAAPLAKKTSDIYSALICSMGAYAGNHTNDLPGIARSITYASDNLPVDFATALIKDYLSISDDFRSALIHMPEFKAFVLKKGVKLNGYI